MMAGLPDIIACVDGLFVGFETKMPAKREEVSEKQKLVHKQIRKAHGKAVVICTPEEALWYIDNVLFDSDDAGYR